LYTLRNVIEWGVSAPGLDHPTVTGPDVIDTFGVTATVQVNAVPEPASVVMMLMGTILPPAALWLRRRRRAIA
jgi:hypothetical protein